MPARVTIADRALFDDEIRAILNAFDAYVRAEQANGAEPTVARFHALRGKELGFTVQSLQRWLTMRRRYGERPEGGGSRPIRT